MVFGITRVRDEDDIVEYSLRRMTAQVDHVIIGEGCSTDQTRPIVERLVAQGLPITLLDDEALNFEQREVMTRYAHIAREMGATWGVFYDTDEAWTADGGRIADVLPALADDVLIVHADNTTHCATSEDDPSDPDPMGRMKWRQANVLPLGKVACRLRDDLVIGHGNHSAGYDDDQRPLTIGEVLHSRHFPYRTPEQFIKRVRIAYPMLKRSGLPRHHGQHIWEYGECWEQHGDDGLRTWFRDGMFFEDPASDPGLVYDPIPALQLA
jgi:hypothetical protein